jgi:hypothetical protein
MGDRPGTEESSAALPAEAAPPGQRRSRRNPQVEQDEGGRGRIEHLIKDIGSEEEVIRYAAAAQLARLDGIGISQAVVGKVLSIGASNLTHALAGRQPLRNETLRELDKASVSLAPELGHTAGLAQFAVRMRGLLDRESLAASVPPNYFAGTSARSEDELHVMVQAYDILDKFLTAEKAKRGVAGVLQKHSTHINEIVDRLILIAGAPPTPRNIEAQIVAGSLSKYAFGITFGKLEDSLRHTPLGFRVWRTLTKMLLLGQADDARGDKRLSESLRPKVARLLSEAGSLRKESIYPGRSLELELAISVPTNWLRPTTSVTTMLRERATNSDATLRERGTAAHALWQRAVSSQRTKDAAVQKTMRDLVKHFREAEEQRPDIASGLQWVALSLDDLINRDEPEAVCNQWPAVDAPWFDSVQEAAALIAQENIPSWVRAGTRKLFEHILLQNAGVERRKAIETVTAGGYVEPVAEALGRVLRDDRTEAWIRIRAIFALGFMQHRSASTARSLTSACQRACQAVLASDNPTGSQINELHTALFAVGDCYGALGAETDARGVRDQLHDTLDRLVKDRRLQDERMWPVARAMTYLLTFTAQARGRSDPNDLSQELLEVLRDHPDQVVTGEFSKWALRWRFGENGQVNPILHAAR